MMLSANSVESSHTGKVSLRHLSMRYDVSPMPLGQPFRYYCQLCQQLQSSATVTSLRGSRRSRCSRSHGGLMRLTGDLDKGPPLMRN